MALETTQANEILEAGNAASNRIHAHKISESELTKAKEELINLIDKFPVDFKAIFILSKIRAAMPKFDRAKALVEGDAYYKKFLDSENLEPEQLLAIHKNILGGLVTADGNLTPAVQSNPQLVAAVNLIIFGKQPIEKTEFVVEKAFKVIGDVFAETARAEEDRQYNEAIVKDPGHMLEQRELKLCGHPYETIFKESLPALEELDSAGYSNFNRVIRNLILKHQRKEITLDKFLERLRYSAAMLAIALEQRGYISEAVKIRATIFGKEYVGDGKLAGAFVNKDKKHSHKKRQLLTQETKQQAAGFLDKIKEQLKDLPALLGFKGRKVPATVDLNNTTLQGLPTQLEDFLNTVNFEGDPEAIRRLENRIVKLRAALNAIALSESAGQNIELDDSLRADLPYNNPDLLRAFMLQLEKLTERLKPETEKTYYPTMSKV